MSRSQTFPTEPLGPSTRPQVIKRGPVPVRLRWQTYTDYANELRVIRWRGMCQGCGRNVYEHIGSSNDPRGAVGDNTLDPVPLVEDDELPDYLTPADGGQRTIAACAMCAQTGEIYRRVRAVASARLREHGSLGALDMAPLVWPDETDVRIPGPAHPAYDNTTES